MSENADVVVVGTGIVGLSVAASLQDRGARVCLLDAGGFADGTSADGTWAWLNATAKTSDRRYHDLNRVGMGRYDALGDRYGDAAIGLSARGGLHWASQSQEPADAARLAEMLRVLRAWNYPVVPVDAADLRALEPAIAFRDDDAGMLATGDRWLDTRRFLGFQRAKLERGGATLRFGCKVARIVPEAGHVRLDTTLGPITAARCVVTAGAAASALLDPLRNIPYPLRARPGLMVETATLPPAALPRHVLHFPGVRELHARPTADGRLLLGSYADDDELPDNADPRDAAAAGKLVDALRPWLTDASGLATGRLRTGIRPVPLDGRPICDWVGAGHRVYAISTHSGVTLSLHLAELAADEVTGGASTELAGYRLDRFTPVT